MPSVNISKPSNCYGHESLYEELVFRDNTFAGSCLSWLNFLTNKLLVLTQHNTPIKLTLSAITSTHMESIETVVCSSEFVVRQFIRAVQYPSNVTETFQCDNNYWNVRLCDSDQPAVCVNCVDPCGNLFCNGLNPFFISPCQSRETSCPAEPFYSRVFNVSFVVEDSLPLITSTSSIESGTTSTVLVSLSSDAYVTCGAIPDSLPVLKMDILSILYDQHQIIPTVNKQANLTVSNLQPLTTYTLFCFPEGFGGFLSYLAIANDLRCIMKNIPHDRKLYDPIEDLFPDVDVQMLLPLVSEEQLNNRRRLESKNGTLSLNSAIMTTSISTTCCYLLYIQINRIYVYHNTDQINILTIYTNFPPVKKAIVTTISIFFQGSIDPIWIETIQFSDKNISSVHISLSREHLKLAGNYSVLGVVNSSDYTFSFSSTSFHVFPRHVALSAPIIITATLLPSTSEVLVEFDSPTNRAGITASTFFCSILLTFVEADKTLCSWGDDSSFRIFLRRDSTVLPGERIQFNGTVLRAQCTDENVPLCDSWPATGIQFISITLLVTTESYVPVVIINAPEIIAIFSDVYLDLTNSLGHGSRPWSSVNFKVFSNSNASSAFVIKSYLNTNYRIFLPSAIPSALIYPGTYNIVARLCNFLGFCSFASHSITIIQNYYPQLTIAGPISVSVFNHESLKLTALARVYAMYGDKISASAQNISFLWTISQSATAIRNLNTPEFTRDEFSIPAYSFTPNLIYSVTVAAMSDIYFKVTSATVIVFVEEGNVVALISGGDQQWIKEGGGSLSISAAASFIEDLSPGESLSLLSFSWKCFQFLPFYSTDCSLSSEISPDGNTITVKTTFETSNTGSTITVIVSYGTRCATRSVNVLSYSDSRPIVAIDSLKSGKVVNPSASFFISATVAVEESNMLECSLSLNDSSIPITTLTYSPAKLAFPSLKVIARPIIPIYFGVVPSMLGYSQGLRFSVSCVNDQRLTATNFIDITINQPPTAGVIVVNPLVGVELTDIFSMIAIGWYDENMPLSLEFGYIDADNLTQCLQYRSGRLYGYSKLTRIDSEISSLVSVVVSVYDAIDAWTRAESVVEVVEVSWNESAGGDFGIQILRDFIANQTFIDTALTNLKTQTVVLGTTFLNNHPLINNTAAQTIRSLFATNLYQFTEGYSDVYTRSAWLAALLAMTRPSVYLWLNSLRSLVATLNYVVQESSSSDYTFELQERVFILVNRLTFAMTLNTTIQSTDVTFNSVRQSWSILNALGLNSFIIGQRGGNYHGGYFQSLTVAKYLNSTGSNTFSFKDLYFNSSLNFTVTNYIDTTLLRLSVSSYAFRSTITNLSMSTLLQSISSPITLQLEDLSFCIANNCTTTLVFYNYEDQFYNGTRSQVVSTYCEIGLAQYFTHRCDSGVNYTVYCDGEHSGFVNSSCPYVVSLPLCYIEYNLYENSKNRTLCFINEYTSSYTVCTCNNIQMASIPMTAVGYSFAAMKYIEKHTTLFYSSTPAKNSHYPVILLLVATTINIDGPVSALLSTQDSNFICDLFYDILTVPRSAIQVSSSERTSSTSIAVNVTTNITTNSFCTEDSARSYYVNSLQTLSSLYNTRISTFIAKNITVLQNSVAKQQNIWIVNSLTMTSSALQKTFCSDISSSPTLLPVAIIKQNTVALTYLSSAPTNFAPFEFVLTYSLALILFFVISAFYFYFYSKARIDFIDKRVAKLPPITTVELPKASAKELAAKSQPIFQLQKTPSISLEDSLDIQYSNLFSLSSEFEHRNRRRHRLKDRRIKSEYSLWDRHIDSANSLSPIANTASSCTDRPLAVTPSITHPVTENDADTIGYSVSQEVFEKPTVNRPADCSSSTFNNFVESEPLNNLSFYNELCSTTGLLEDNAYDYDGITMMSNPVKRSQKNFIHRKDLDDFNMSDYKDDTTILFGNEQTDERNIPEATRPRNNDTQDAAELDRRLSSKRKLEYYLNKLSPQKQSESTTKEPSPDGLSVEEGEVAAMERSRITSFSPRRQTIFANKISEESAPVRKLDPLDVNLTRRQSLSYYIKKLDPATARFRRRPALFKDSNNASQADLRMTLAEENKDTSRGQELDVDH